MTGMDAARKLREARDTAALILFQAVIPLLWQAMMYRHPTIC